MATVASLNILLNLNNAGFRRGVESTVSHIEKLDNRIALMAHQYGTSESKVRKAINENIRAAQQQRQAFLGVSKSIGQVGNSAAAAAASVRGMLTFGAGRVAGGVGMGLGNMAQVVGSIIGPTERLGQTVSTVIGGSFSAAGKIVGAFGDIAGLAISSVSVMAGKLGGSVLSLIPMIGPALGGIVNMFGELGTVIGSVVGGAFRVFGEVLGGVGKIAGEVAGGVVSALVTVGTSAVMSAAKFEQMELAFAGMLGSADKAKSVLDELFQFAAVTPFTFEGVTQATQRLLAFGFSAEDSIGIMKRMADVAAAMPTGIDEGLKRVTRAIGEMQAKGRVSAQEMRQLADAGIPVWDALAQRIGVSVPRAMKLAENNMLSARDGIMSLLDLSQRYTGMSDKLGKSMLGLWSTLKDNVQLTMRDLGMAIIEAFDLKGMTGKLTEVFQFLRSNIESIKPALVEIGTVFRATFDIAISMVKLAVDALKDWSGQVAGAPTGLQEMRNAILDAMEAIGTATIETITSMANAALQVIHVVKKVGNFIGDAINQVLTPHRILAENLVAFAQWVDRDAAAQESGKKNALGMIVGGGGLRGGGGGLRGGGGGPDLFNPDALINRWRDGLNVLRATASGLGRGPDSLAGILGGGIANLVPKALPALQFGQLGNGIEQAVDKAFELERKLEDIRFQFKQLIPHQEMLGKLNMLRDGFNEMGAVMGGAFAGAAVVGEQALQRAEGALNRSSGQILRDLRSKFGPKNIDVGAMQKGSQEAASAINRAINEAKMPSGDPTVEELRLIKGVMDKQKSELERHGAMFIQIAGQIGLAGVGP